MPIPKRIKNGFTASEVASITGLSRPMIAYLRRIEFLVPDHGDKSARRGKICYYSYRDLVAARLIQKLRSAGVELARLKEAVLLLKKHWGVDPDGREKFLKCVVTDGCEILLSSDDEFLDTLRKDGQRAFAFIVNIEALTAEVRALVPKEKQESFTLRVEALELAVR